LQRVRETGGGRRERRQVQLPLVRDVAPRQVVRLVVELVAGVAADEVDVLDEADAVGRIEAPQPRVRTGRARAPHEVVLARDETLRRGREARAQRVVLRPYLAA